MPVTDQVLTDDRRGVTLIDPPPSALLLSSQSPGYDINPPEVLYPERIPPDIYAACSVQRHGHFGPRPIRIWLLRDVVVAWEGLVFDQNGCLFRPSVTQHHPLEIEWAREQVALIRNGGEIAHHTLPLVLGEKRGATNFGHWLLEMLPMLHMARDRLCSDTLGVLVHDVTDPQLGSVMLDSLRRIGVPDLLVRVCDARPIRVDRLLLVEGLSEHGTYMSPHVTSCVARLMDGIEGAGHERVFIARGRDMRRDFADAVHVEHLARQSGFHVMRPDDLTLSQQMACLRDARVISGAMGAAMTNLVFARPGAQILMFTGAAMPDTFFWFAASLFGHRYREMRCLQDEQIQGLFYDRALLVSDDDIATFLRVTTPP